MFKSNRWKSYSWENTADGKAFKKIITRDANFCPGLVYSLKATEPLVGVLRLVDSEATPAIGFIYDAMDRAKEEITKNSDNEEARYKEIWDIIDEKWDFQMHRDLHAAGYFINP
ncbi:hypothetical protein MKX01_026594 [Papaver californicum]|nr:hypothetical protein MKX01_026594 [Papaver californicum]